MANQLSEIDGMFLSKFPVLFKSVNTLCLFQKEPKSISHIFWFCFLTILTMRDYTADKAAFSFYASWRRMNDMNIQSTMFYIYIIVYRGT